MVTMNIRKFPAAAAVASLALLATVEPAGAQQLFSLTDPSGDDDGGGVLSYPNRPDLQQGDLDLVRVSAEQRSDGTWFTVEMAQPIREPSGQVLGVSRLPVERLARHGFYTFNVDLYIDQDRIEGLGRTDALPGRDVTIDPKFAWERAVVLTPRPDTARTMMQMYTDRLMETDLRAKQGRLSDSDVDSVESRSEAEVNSLYYFPTKVRVSSRKIEFLVPTEFLGGEPQDNWAYTVLVTAADLEQAAEPRQSNPRKATMMTLGVGTGMRADLWGVRSGSDLNTPPVIDILAPDRARQVAALTDYDPEAGRLPAVPGIAVDGKEAVAMADAQLTAEQAARLEATTARPTGGKPAAGGSGAAPKPAEKRAVPARLRTLTELRDQGLITEAEYNELRRKILTEL